MRAPSIALAAVIARIIAGLDTAIAAEASASGLTLALLQDDASGESGKAVYSELIERYGFPYVCVEPPEGDIDAGRASTASELTMWVLLAFQTAEQGRSGRLAAAYLSALASVFSPSCTAGTDTRVVNVTCSPSFSVDQDTFVRIVGAQVRVKVVE